MTSPCACLGTLVAFSGDIITHGPDRCYTEGQRALEVTIGKCPRCAEVQRSGAGTVCADCIYKEAWL